MSTINRQLFGARLAKMRLSKGLSVPEFSEKIKEPERSIRLWEKGQSIPRAYKLRKIAEFFEETVDFLTAASEAAPQAPTGMRKIPIISEAQAGPVSRDYQDTYNQSEEFVWSDTKDLNAFAIRIVGDSMEPFASPGDIAVFDPNQPAENGQEALVKLKESGDVFFKLFFRSGERGEIVYLASANRESYPTRKVGIDEIEFRYKLHNLIRRPKSWNIIEFLPQKEKKKT